jgi:hypothetical protein
MYTRENSLRSDVIRRVVALALMIAACAGQAAAQDISRSSVVIEVQDEQGGIIVGAQATLIESSGREAVKTTNDEGRVLFPDLSSGRYGIRVTAPHFKAYEERQLQVAGGRDTSLRVTLRIAGVEENVAVFPDTSIAQFAEYIGGSLVIRGDALLAFDAPGGLENLLRALALRSSGPFGPIALVNGFEDGQLPPTYSIREIRINDNPFSAEYATLGLGRIEILTKPGTEKLHFAGFGILGDANLNSRNPFAADKVRYRSRMVGGNVSAPIAPRKAAFFADFNQQQVDANAVINATILSPDGRITSLQQAVVTPQLRKSFSPRLDFQLGANHTWVMRYGDMRSHTAYDAVGEFSLLSRAQNSDGRVQTFQLTETAVLSSKSINELRAQLVRTKTSRAGNNSTPAINVQEAFLGGGADIGRAYNRHILGDLQDVLSYQGEKHNIKAGAQGRYTMQRDGSTQNFGGMYTFASRIAPQLTSTDQPLLDSQEQPILIPITTIEAYRRTVLFSRQGLSPEEVRQLGGGASQFSITAGGIETQTKQFQSGVFVQDNWRLHPNFTLSTGVRYELQNKVSRRQGLAPRLGFAWAIGGATSRQTVVRGGIGLYYDRIPENVVLRAKQLDGFSRHQYIVSDPSILDFFPAIPKLSTLAGFSIPQASVRLAPDLRAPYTINSSVALERQLFGGLTFAATVSRLRSVHLMRSRNINAPLPGTFDPTAPERAIRPLGSTADVFQYESSGSFNEQQLLLNMIYRAGKDVTLWSTYTLRDAKADTESPDTFPANHYDLRADYSRPATLARHSLYWGGWIRMRGGIDLTPLVLWRSALPFDITTGRDNNGDSIFNDRPAFATDLTRPSVVRTSLGAFDLNPTAGQHIIPRNFGNTPAFWIANLRVGKRIALGTKAAIVLSIQGTNIFNHTNFGTPIGNIGSELFGRSNASAGDWGLGSNPAGNRRMEAMLHFQF